MVTPYFPNYSEPTERNGLQNVICVNFAFPSDKDKADRISKAESPSSHPFLLLRLSLHSDKEVRMAVADNPSSPRSALMRLAKDSDPDVRYALAENHNIWPPILKQLTEDENPYVQSRATQTFERILELGYASTSNPYFDSFGGTSL